ncbi:MAG: CRISPR-associated protein Csx19 [Gemmataceae bacterium]|nr:CRISPR-associated protein Csx19 [Gemmataceae bacterium]
MSVALFVYTRQNVQLQEALSVFAGLAGENRATAILYSPRHCELAILTRGELQNAEGQAVSLNYVFEARIFHEAAELRWLNDPSPEKRHRAVILTEQDVSPYLEGWNREKANDVIDKLEQTYLLWGEGTGRAVNDGWSELATARLGGLKVPVSGVGKKDFVLLHSVEYIVEAEHGNAIVFDERMVKLEVARG